VEFDLMEARSLLRHAAIYGLGNLLFQLVGVLLLPILVRRLTPAEFGILEVLNRLGDVAAYALLLGGVQQATLTFYNQATNPAERRAVVSTAVMLVGTGAALACLLSVLVARPLGEALGTGQPLFIVLAVAATMSNALTTVSLTLSQARAMPTRYVVTTMTQFLAKIALSLYFMVVLGWGLWGWMLAWIITSAAYGAGLGAFELAESGLHLDSRLLGRMLAFALPFLPGGICFFLMNYGDRFLLLRYADKAEIGLYALGCKLAAVVGVFSRGPLYQAWSARMYDAARRSDAPVIFGRVFTWVLAAYLLVGLGVSLLREEIVWVLGGQQYSGAAQVVAIVVLAYYFLAAADLMDACFYIRRRTSLKLGITLCSTVSMLLCYAFLIPRYHALGAAWATLAGFIVHATATYAVSRRVFHTHYEVGKLAAMLTSAVVLWLVAQLVPSLSWGIPMKIMLWALWPGLLWITGVIAQEEKDWVRLTLGRLVSMIGFRFSRWSTIDVA
jgi:O-antigen/teichoic acid export membrane protein